MSRTLLVVVPCGKAKVWSKFPDAGDVAAKDAYVGSPFRLNRKLAETFADAWVILSAKYGFVEPTFKIPGPYDVFFKRKRTGPISLDQLASQVREQRLGRFPTVIGLGGKEYREAVQFAFTETGARVLFPFAGSQRWEMTQGAKAAIERGNLCGFGSKR
jgi:hypothetical protein